MKKLTRLLDLAPGNPTDDSFIRITTDEWSSGIGDRKEVWGDVYLTVSDNYRIVKIDLESNNAKTKARNLAVLRLLAKHIIEAADVLENIPVGPAKPAPKPAAKTRKKKV